MLSKLKTIEENKVNDLFNSRCCKLCCGKRKHKKKVSKDDKEGLVDTRKK